MQRIFPFNHFNDEDDFMEAVSELRTSYFDHTLVNDRILNVFDYNDGNENIPMLDVDPDNNYYNQSVMQCDYFSVEDFHKRCKDIDSS